MSQIIMVILLSIFNGEQGTLPDTFGVLLHGPSKEQLRSHFDFSILCQDGASQKYSFGVKGDSGSKSCLKCTETAIVPPGADAEEAAANTFKPKSALQLTDDKSVLSSFDKLQEKWNTLPADQFALWPQATGRSFSAEGLWASKLLRSRIAPITNFMHDWMHGVAQGSMPVSIYLFMEAMARAGLKSWHSMENYLQLWEFPASYKNCSYVFVKRE